MRVEVGTGQRRHRHPVWTSQVVVVETVRPQAELPVPVAERDAQRAHRVPDPDEVRHPRRGVLVPRVGAGAAEPSGGGLARRQPASPLFRPEPVLYAA